MTVWIDSVTIVIDCECERIFEDWMTTDAVDVVLGSECEVEIELEGWMTLETTLERIDELRRLCVEDLVEFVYGALVGVE
jgi:hypothetical protein